MAVKFRYSFQWNKIADVPSADQTSLVNEFTITFKNPCSSDTLTTTPASADAAYSVYSGARRDLNPGWTVTHSSSATCGTYHSLLIEVSDGAGSNWVSSGKQYDDVLASKNTDMDFVIKPNPLVFDSSSYTTPVTRKIRVTVTHTINASTLQRVYTVTILGKQALCKLAEDNIATTLTVAAASPNIDYTVGGAPIIVPTVSMKVLAPTDSTHSNVNLPVCATSTKLYYGTASGSENTAVATDPTTASWVVGSGTCLTSVDSVRFGFTVYCTNNALWTHASGSKTHYMKFTTWFTDSPTATPVTVNSQFTFTVKSKCFNDVLQRLSPLHSA
jgi:hypothetical protein